MQRKIKIFTLALVLVLGVCSLATFVSCNDNPAENVTVTVSQKEIQLEVGQTQKLTVSVEPVDALDKNIEWKSSDETVVTVKDGLVTAVAEGEAVITVTTNKKSDTCKVTVLEAGETPATPDNSNGGSNGGSDNDSNGSNEDSGNPSEGGARNAPSAK